MRRLIVIALASVAMLVMSAVPGHAIIHELVASHCSGHQGLHGNVDPPGQLNTQGNSFAAALQATGVYTFEEGVDQAGELGFNLLTQEFGPMPSPGDEVSVTIWTDPTRASAKLDADSWMWVYFVDDELFGEPLHIYLQLYDLDHPAFDHCPNFPDDAP
jgi:hypothetical protein